LNDKETNIIDLGHSKVFLRDDGIVQVNFAHELLLDVKQCRELNATYDKILGDKKHPILHIAGKYTNVTSGARNYGASEEGLRNSIAEAYVISSLAHKILANFYMKFNKPKIPTQFFKTEEEAIVWLRTFVK